MECLRYKKYPLVRSKDDLYIGSMGDKYVIWLKIIEKDEDNTATNVGVYLCDTTTTLPIKKVNRNSLYEAIDLGYSWLVRFVEKGEEVKK